MFELKKLFGLSQRKWRLAMGLLLLTMWYSVLALCQASGQLIHAYYQEGGDGTNTVPNYSIYPNVLDSQHSNAASRIHYLLYSYAYLVANSSGGGYSCALYNPNLELDEQISNSNAVMGQGDTGAGLAGLFHQLQLLKQYNPALKVLISLQSSSFSEAAASGSANVTALAQQCVNMFVSGHFTSGGTAYPGIFDGIDIDWEFPNLISGPDATNYPALLSAFRTALGSHPLTAATGVGPYQYGGGNAASDSSIETLLANSNSYLDYFHVMTYDYYGGEPDTSFNAPLFATSSGLQNGPDADSTDSPNNSDWSIQTLYLSGAKINPAKLIMGIPLYGKQWSDVESDSNDGLFQAATYVGTVPYSQVATDIESGDFTHYCDSGSGSAICPSNWGSPLTTAPTTGAQESWLYGNVDGSSNVITYDDTGSMAAKVKYAQANQLAGVLVWDVTQDTPSQTLMTAIMNDTQPAGTCANPNPNPNPNPVSFANPGDFNGDCKSDILWQNSSSGQLYEWLMNGTTTLSQTSPGSGSSPWAVVGEGDFNGDGKADLLWRNSSTGQLYMWLMNGSTIIGQVSPGTVSTAWSVVGVGDFNGDGKADILWWNSSTGQVYIWLMNGSTITSQETPGSASSPWTITAVGDFNGDGKADILWQNSSTGQIYIWLMNGTTVTFQGTPGGATSPWSIAGVGDFNDDGKSDLVWWNSSTGQVYIWLMDGTTVAGQPTPGGASAPWSIKAVGDYNGDGKADLLWQNSSTGQVYIWLMNGTTIASQGTPGGGSSPWQIFP